MPHGDPAQTDRAELGRRGRLDRRDRTSYPGPAAGPRARPDAGDPDPGQPHRERDDDVHHAAALGRIGPHPA
jgi:hypothetical protein